MLRGDRTRLRQILNTVLSNAVKFTDNGQIVLRVQVVNRDDERIEVRWQVADSGVGIRQEDQKFLFEPFYQTVGNTNVIAGTGLGLSICQRLAALMNGSIGVVSAPGLGSSFTLNLPLELAHAAAGFPSTARLLPEMVHVFSPSHEMAEYIASWLRSWGAKTQTGRHGLDVLNPDDVLLEVYPHERHEKLLEWEGPRVILSAETGAEIAAPNHWHVSPNDLKGIFEAVSQAQGVVQSSGLSTESNLRKQLNLRVLVAEDNVINQLILKDQLEELGCSVRLASDGQEALLSWQGSEFDVILSDINMPRLNGYELARELRRLGCGIPIIGATANAMRDESDRCLEAGMQQLLVKPFSLNALFNCLQNYERKPDSVV
jgi:two-component system capsular synthesis sensor histidine kinase RcsC